MLIPADEPTGRPRFLSSPSWRCRA